ncbi:hypothetical protein BDF14DRAFT_1837529 [Spinellus fusiger]|nr:hypothetical protein BDF14DRAFT_1837529 [Spinellus fusiger]
MEKPLPAPLSTTAPTANQKTSPARLIPADLVPDLHTLAPSSGLSTELATHNTTDIRQTITKAETKPVLPFYPPPTHKDTTTSSSSSAELMAGVFPDLPWSASRLPPWYQAGWTAFSTLANPGGPANSPATYFTHHPLDQLLPDVYYGEWWHNAAALCVTGLVAWGIGYGGGGLGPVLLVCLCLGTYYRASVRRFRRNTRDDIQRELTKHSVASDEETVEWMNLFVQKFWLVFEPVLSALVVENLDTYMTDYLPPFLDSVRLTTFTLGTKPFRVMSVKTYPHTDPDTVCMDWKVSFIPHDLLDASAKDLNLRINPRIVMTARVGTGSLGAGIPIVIEDMSFTGHLRVTIRFMSRFPYAKTVGACFLEKPEFDYVCKPLGGDSFGFDVNIIPGLQSFIQDQIHTILGPLFYAPNIFTVDVEKFMEGELDMSQANGVLAVTLHGASTINDKEHLIYGNSNPYIRFYVDHGQELGRSSIKGNTLEPEWEETHFLLVNNLNSQLCMELRDHNPGAKDRRLATGIFNLQTMDRHDRYGQEGLDILLLKDGKTVSCLDADLHYLPISKPIKHMNGTIEPAVESNSGVLRLVVHECNGLQGSTLHPYVRVFINGTEKLKTRTVKRTDHPVYEEPTEMVIIDKTEVYLRAEVRNATDDSLLGVSTVYLNDWMRTQQNNDYRLTLTLDKKETGTLRMSAQWKPILMAGLSEGLGSHGFDCPSIGVVRISLWEARDLRNVELVTNGKSDPYVRVMSGLQTRARTAVVDNNLYPEWGEVHYVPIHSPKEDLLLEVMDWNQKTKDKSLGAVTLCVGDLVEQRIGDQAENPDRWCVSTGKIIDEWAQLHSIDQRITKGELRYTAEFLPILALPQPVAPAGTEKYSGAMDRTPLKDLNGSYVSYTPDGLVDLVSYRSGVLKVTLHQVSLPDAKGAYCHLLVDSLTPQYKTGHLKGKELRFEETADAFIKESDFSRIAIEVKPLHSDEKSELKIGYWVESASNIIRRLQQQRRKALKKQQEEEKEEGNVGEWYTLSGSNQGRICLSFDYLPLSSFELSPDESIENQGNLTISNINAKNIMAADKSGTSDPYVIFTINGERVHKSAIIKKTLNPVWSNEKFTVAIQSRVTASLRVELFDWNHIKSHGHIGSGGITLQGDILQSFVTRMVDIPLDGVTGVSGSVRAHFLWQPQLLINKKTQTSVLGNKSTYTSELVGASLDQPLALAVGALPSVQEANDEMEDQLHLHKVVSSDTESAGKRSRFSMESLSHMTSVTEGEGSSESRGAQGVINVCVLEARGLRGMDKSGTSDPFVCVIVGKRPAHKTRVIKKTLTPEWNEAFSVSITDEPTVFDFKVIDHNSLKPSVDIGVCRWNIWDLIHLDTTESLESVYIDQWLPLHPLGSGELRIRFEFTPSSSL